MFKIKDHNIPLPQRYAHAERLDPTIKTQGWDKVDGYLLRDKVDFMPQKGLQEKLCACDSNLIFICGSATSGKTYSMMLKALRNVDKQGFTGRFISVRLIDSKKGSSIFRDAIEVWGNFSNCQVSTGDYPTFAWQQWNSNIQLIHSNFNVANPSEWEDFQEYAKKNQASYIAIDEATDITEFKMFAYWFSRNRDASGAIPTMVLSFNPKHNHFTTKMLLDAGYIGEDWYLDPKMDGVTRYFYIKGDNPEDIIWGDTKESVANRANIELSDKDREAGITETDMVKSFTMLTGEASGNLKLLSATRGQSVANLHATGKTQRSILKGAYFGAVLDEESTVTREMIRDMWANPYDETNDMYATLDVSGGKSESDDIPMIIWKGFRICAIRTFRGNPKELVEWIDTMLSVYEVPVEHFAFDATGIGNYLTAYTMGYPVTANKAAIQEYDTAGNPITLEQYFNLRSQLLGKMKVLFETGKISCAVAKTQLIDYGKKGEKRKLIDILYDEINIFISVKRNKRIYFRSKDEYKARFHSSPDLMDSIALRAIFEIDGKHKKEITKEIEDDAYNALYNTFDGNIVWT